MALAGKDLDEGPKVRLAPVLQLVRAHHQRQVQLGSKHGIRPNAQRTLTLATLALAWSALGVIYGDIGTSPLCVGGCAGRAGCSAVRFGGIALFITHAGPN